MFDSTGRLASRMGWASLTVSPIGTAITFAAAPTSGATSQNLSTNWGGATDTYGIVFSDGEVRQATLTNGQVTCVWTVPLTGNPTTSATARPALQSIAELALGDGTTFIVAAGQQKIYAGTTALTDVTGTLTPTGDNWQWLTFFGAIYGVQAGNPLIKWNGTGNFDVITPATGTVPTGGSCGVAAFGRLWILNSDNQTISYCQLGDDTNWAVTGAGSINMATVWTRGIDTVVGLAAAGSKLVVFGTKQIVLYADSQGAVIGLNPANLYVYDTIEGTGLSARDTVQSTGEGDLTFLSPTGIQSLQRLLTSGKDNPVAALDAQVHDYFNSYFLNEDPAAVRSVYSPTNRYYLILLPFADRIFAYDTRMKLQDGSLRVTEWPAVSWSSMVNRKSGDVLFGEFGQIGQAGGYSDNGASYGIVYNSPWLALGSSGEENFENRMKILKRMKTVLFHGAPVIVTFSWGTEFAGLTQSYQLTLTGTISEYGLAQYGINEYGGGAGITVQSFPLSTSGRWMQYGVTATISGAQLAIQQLDAFVKIGNMA